jgi:hypothetical protein
MSDEQKGKSMSKTIEGIIAALERHADEAERQAVHQVRECTRELLAGIARDHRIAARLLSEYDRKNAVTHNKSIDNIAGIN